MILGDRHDCLPYSGYNYIYRGIAVLFLLPWVQNPTSLRLLNDWNFGLLISGQGHGIFARRPTFTGSEGILAPSIKDYLLGSRLLMSLRSLSLVEPSAVWQAKGC